MFIIFNFLDYRTALNTILNQLKAENSKYGLVYVAEKTQIHGSYLSSAMRLKKHLQLQQIYRIAEFLKLSSSEALYLDLLSRYNKSEDRFQKSILKTQVLKQYIDPKNTKKRIKTNDVAGYNIFTELVGHNLLYVL